MIAGTDMGLANLVGNLAATHDIFLMEDGLLNAATGATALETLYQGGSVPITYKSFYYGMTKSVDLKQWPPDWVAKDAVYYPKTKAPESLPPIVK